MPKTTSETLLELAEKFKAASESKTRPPELAEQDRRYELACRLASKLAKPKAPRAAPNIPESADVLAYAPFIGLPGYEAQLFIDHFKSNGWKVGGKAPMKDWQAAMRMWRSRWAKDNPEAAARMKVANAPVVSHEPEGWLAWLKSKNYPLTPYKDARSYLKTEFKNRNQSPQ